MIAFYIVGYFWKRQLPKRASEIDLDVRRHLSLPESLLIVLIVVWQKVMVDCGGNGYCKFLKINVSPNLLRIISNSIAQTANRRLHIFEYIACSSQTRYIRNSSFWN